MLSGLLLLPFLIGMIQALLCHDSQVCCLLIQVDAMVWCQYCAINWLKKFSWIFLRCYSLDAWRISCLVSVLYTLPKRSGVSEVLFIFILYSPPPVAVCVGCLSLAPWSLLIYILTGANIWLLLLILVTKMQPSTATRLSDTISQLIWYPFICVLDQGMMDRTHLLAMQPFSLSLADISHQTSATVPDWLKECIFATLVTQPSPISWVYYLMVSKLLAYNLRNLLQAATYRHHTLSRWDLALVLFSVILTVAYSITPALQDRTCLFTLLMVTTYCCVTEEACREGVIELVGGYFEDRFEGLERFIFHTKFTVMQIALMVPCVYDYMWSCQALIIPMLFINIYLPLKSYHQTIWQSWREASEKLLSYARATHLQLKEHNDVCAICLTEMRYARVTPCFHLFHGKCLARCLQEKETCPICNRNIWVTHSGATGHIISMALQVDRHSNTDLSTGNSYLCHV